VENIKNLNSSFKKIMQLVFILSKYKNILAVCGMCAPKLRQKIRTLRVFLGKRVKIYRSERKIQAIDELKPDSDGWRQ